MGGAVNVMRGMAPSSRNISAPSRAELDFGSHFRGIHLKLLKLPLGGDKAAGIGSAGTYNLPR